MYQRPWWGNPRVWLLVAAVSSVIGVMVWPKLFGFTFLFVPFVWMSRGRARHHQACASCGSPLDPGFAFCPRCGAPVR